MTNDLNITGQFNIDETTEQTGGSEEFEVINSKPEPPGALPEEQPEEQPEEPGDGDSPENSPTGAEPDGPVPTNELEMAGYLVRHCRNCSLGWTRTNAVPGDGPMDAEVMIVAEGPGKNEDQQGLPFVGAAGKFLDELLPMAGLSRDQVFITNVIKCRAPDNRDPQPEEVKACSRHLYRQIKIINPRLIIALGKFSLGWFFPGETIGKARGRLRQKNGLFIYPVMHPAAGLRRSEFKERVKADFQKIPAILKQIEEDPPEEEPDAPSPPVKPEKKEPESTQTSMF